MAVSEHQAWSVRHPTDTTLRVRRNGLGGGARIVSGGDDMLPDPDHSAEELAAQFLAHFQDDGAFIGADGNGIQKERQCNVIIIGYDGKNQVTGKFSCQGQFLGQHGTDFSLGFI